VLVLAGVALPGTLLAAQDTTAVRAAGDRLTIRFVETDLRAAIQALGRYLPKPVLVGAIEPRRVTFETPNPVPRSQVAALLRGLVESQGLTLMEDSVFFRVEIPSAAASAALPRGGEVGERPVQLFVLRLKHARAPDVAATVNLLFGGAGAFSGTPGLSGGSLADELRRDEAQTLQAPPETTADQDSRGASLAGPVTIVPDELTNSLLVRASLEDFAVIAQAVEQLDLRPLQVLIQVLIVEIRRDRALQIGVEGMVDGVNPDDQTTVSGTLFGGGLGDFVLQVMRIGTFQLDAALSVAVSRGDARIVSRPVLLASNNREARILVGSQRPFVQVSRSLPTDAPSRDQVVQYRDVGTKLTVLPTINQDGYVSLLIRQEVNAATSETQFDAPVISTREAETEVLVKDGQTIVLGGLRERQTEVVKTGIPVLSALPLLGGLFGFQDRRTTETELFLFITPRVLKDDEAAEEAAREALERVSEHGIKPEVPVEREP
jgi:general secretion pathway protein D